jgi:hypothetical protein
MLQNPLPFSRVTLLLPASYFPFLHFRYHPNPILSKLAIQALSLSTTFNPFSLSIPVTTFPVQSRTQHPISSLFLASSPSPAEDKYSTSSHSSPCSASSVLPHISLHEFLLKFAIPMRPSEKLDWLFRDIDDFGSCFLRRSRRVWVWLCGCPRWRRRGRRRR